MSAKPYYFLIRDLRTKVWARVSAEGKTLAGALGAAWRDLPAEFDDRLPGLRLFSFDMFNGRTREHAAFIGQGETMAEAFAEAVKGTRDSFRPKNDGKLRPAVGVLVRCPPLPGDTYAVCSTVSRSVESFEGDETIAEEAARLAREAEKKRMQNEGKAA